MGTVDKVFDLEDVLSERELLEIEALASASTEGAKCAQVEPGEPIDEVLSKLTDLSSKVAWLSYCDLDSENERAMMLGYFGNGPESEANARFFSIARSCVLAMLVHIRKIEESRRLYGNEIGRLAACILENHASEIQAEDGAIDVAIRLLSPKPEPEGRTQ